MNWNALLPELVLVFGIFFIFILDLFASKKHYRTLTYISALVPIASFSHNSLAWKIGPSW